MTGEGTHEETTPPPLELKQLNSLRLGRDSIINWLPERDFADIVVGLFCRVAMGKDESKKKAYQVARVEGIKNVDVNSNSVEVTLRFGDGSVKDISLDLISNGMFREEELAQYIAEASAGGFPIITPASIKSKIKAIKEFVGNAANKADPRKRGPDDEPRVVEEEKRVPHEAKRARRGASDDAAPRRGRSYEDLERELEAVRAERDSMAQQVKDMSGRATVVNLKERQIKEMRYELEKLADDVEQAKADKQTTAALLNAEREALRILKVKLKEMDCVIQQQTTLITELQDQLLTERKQHLTIANKRLVIAKKYKALKDKAAGASGATEEG